MSESNEVASEEGKSAEDRPRPEQVRRVVVAIGGSSPADRLIDEAQRLAGRLACPWEAIHVETPETSSAEGQNVARLLSRAAQLGASVATIPASDVAAGLEAHLEADAPDILLVGFPSQSRRIGLRRRSLLDRLADWPSPPTLVIVPRDASPRGERLPLAVAGSLSAKAPPRAYWLTLLLVALTTASAVALQRVAGARTLDLLFLFPVISAAAQFGLRPALAGAAVSVLAYNFFLIPPHHTLGFKTPQSVVMAIVLVLVAVYTSVITGRLRSRARLSDRSASENARIASFGQALAAAADWDGTGQLVCREAAALLQVQAAVLREKEGELQISGATPEPPRFSPVDHAALDLCWLNGSPAGSGTDSLPAADWQFQPLKTSLGTLAILAVARSDGRDPVQADRAVLFSTLIAQAALAHERLRLEDQMRAGIPTQDQA